MATTPPKALVELQPGERFQLFHGECLAGLRTCPDGFADHTICDPPYSEKVHTLSRSGRTQRDAERGSRRNVSRNVDLGFAHITQRDRRAIAGELARVTRRWVLVFCDLESEWLWRYALIKAGLEVVRFGLWRKIGGTPQFTGDRPGTACEGIVIAHRPGRKRWNGGGKPGIWDCPIVLDRRGRGERVHTTQKPVDLMSALVLDFSDHGEAILDPFAGSGTTGVAALTNGRRFIGWEMDEKYHGLALARLRAAREQPGLWRPEAPPMKQADLFGGDSK